MNTQKAIDDALNFLASVQLHDGGFESFSSPEHSTTQPAYTYRTVLVPALILAALSHIDHPGAATIRERIATFLLRQKSAFWSFNYWARDNKEARQLSYPDDLDDTFCALYALCSHNPSIINEQALAGMAHILIATESAPGGPYRTWLINLEADARWHDIDVAVNANIAAFLAIAAEPLPPLTTFLEAVMQREDFTSPYYPSEFPILYYLARAHTRTGTAAIGKRLLYHKQRNGVWGTPLHTALAVTTLRNIGRRPPEKALRFLLETQTTDGSWPREAFCRDPKRDKQAFYQGCPALTTALAIEALYTRPQARAKTQTQAKPPPQPLFFKQVIRQAKRELARLDDDMRQEAYATLDHTMQSRNSPEIILLPHLFSASLRVSARPSRSQLVNLGLANLYGWMAYTIYDDFLDDEPEPLRLGVANASMRRSLQAFKRALPDNQAFQSQVLQTFDSMDAANTWEVTHCRWATSAKEFCAGKLPDFGNLDQLAARSLGHTLTPLAVLVAVGASPQAKQHTLTALRHYIIAKQLSDDTHDWKEDLAAGRITYVVSAVLRSLCLAPGQHQIDKLLPKAERAFWHEILPDVCDEIDHRIALSRNMLVKNKLLETNNVIEKLLDRLESYNKETKATTKQVETFLQAYQDAQNYRI